MLPPVPDRPHIPVLLDEVIAHLGVRRGGVYIDGTFGAGGYTTAILEAGAGKVIAIDRDPTAIAAGDRRWLQRYRPAGSPWSMRRFANLADAVADEPRPRQAVDGVVLDIGVSSMQIDQAGARLLVPLRRPAGHAHGAGRARARPIMVAQPRRGPILPISSIAMARSACSRAHRQVPSSRERAIEPIVTTRQRLWPISSAKVVRCQTRRHPPGDPHVPGVAYRGER